MDRSEAAENHENETSPLLGNGLSQNGINYAHDRPVSTQGGIIEDPETYKSRWKSIRVMYFTQFLAAITFSITLSSLWPFLKVLEPSATAGFLGWVVSSYSLGQLIASPLFGAWSNIRKSCKEPLVVTLTLGVIANTFYMYLQSMPTSSNYFLILSRGFIGVSAGNVAVLRSYISGATTMKERTGCMANVSMCQVVGFIMGPVFQAAVVPISYPGPVEIPELHFNMYTAPAFLSAVALLINLILLILFFKEHQIPDEGYETLNVQSDENNEDKDVEKEINSIANLTSLDKNAKPDYVAVFSTIYLFFATLFMFTMLETISTPVTMHMYAWGKKQATFYQGFILGGGGILSFIVFIVIRPLVKRFGDRKMLLGGFIFCFCGYFVFVSWGDNLPPRPFKRINNDAHHISTTHFPNHSVHLSDSFFRSGDPFATYEVQDTDIQKTSEPNVRSFHILHSPHAQTLHHPKDPTPQNRDTSYKTGAIHKFEEHQSGVSVSGDSSSNERRNRTQKSIFSENGKNVSSFHDREVTTSTFIDSSKVTAPHNVTKPKGHITNTTLEPKGCPWSYSWCSDTPLIPLAQYLCATALVSIGYPLCQVFTYVIFSKILGPAPQGIWMGWLTAAGSLARTLGPIYISNMYDKFGPRVTYGSVAGFIFVTTIFNLVVYRRLVPFSAKVKPDDPLKFKREDTQNST